MKKRDLFIPLFAAAMAFASCSENDSVFMNPSVELGSEEQTRSLFPEDDGSLELNEEPHKNARRLLDKLTAEEIKERTDTLGRADITPEQYAEIQAFAQELTKGLTKDKEKYTACFNWITSNIKYAYEYPSGGPVDNNPYPVFTTKYAVCQGYANLLFIMMHSLDVPAFVCNGMVNLPNLIGGHAWNYVYCDGTWYVSDPTNGGSFLMRSPGSYSHLYPSSFDIMLYEENGVYYNYNEYNLNIYKIESDENVFVVPFSVRDLCVASLNPTVELPENIEELYIGKNIKSLGEGYMGLPEKAPGVKYVYVDPANTTFESYLGAVYRKNGDEYQLTYVPAAMKCLELMKMETIYKNTVYYQNGIEVAIITPGTKKIENWAFEQCPNLKIACIPEGVEVASKAFADVHPSFQIIRGDYTNIPSIKAD